MILLPNIRLRITIGLYLGGDAGGAGSEDCLKVDIYAPSDAKANSKCESSFTEFGSVIS